MKIKWMLKGFAASLVICMLVPFLSYAAPADGTIRDTDINASIIPENQWIQTDSTLVWYFGNGEFYALREGQMDLLGFWIVGAKAVQTGNVWILEGGTEYEYEEYKNAFAKEPPLPDGLEGLRPDTPGSNPNPGDGDDKDDPDTPDPDTPDPDTPDPDTPDPDTPDPDTPDPDTPDPDTPDPDTPDPDTPDPDTPDPDTPDPDTPDPDTPDPDTPDPDTPDPDIPDPDIPDPDDPLVPEEIHIGFVPKNDWIQIGPTYYYWIFGSLSVCSLPDGGSAEDLRWHLITDGIFESQEPDLWISGRGYTFEEFTIEIEPAQYPGYMPDFVDPDDNASDTDDADDPDDSDSGTDDKADSDNNLNDLDKGGATHDNSSEKEGNDRTNQSERDDTVAKTTENMAEILTRAGIQIGKDKLEEWADNILEKYPILKGTQKTLDRINAAYEIYKSSKEISEDWVKVVQAQEQANKEGGRNEEIAPFAKKWTSKLTENAYEFLPTEWTDVFGITNNQTGKILGEKAGNWAADAVGNIQKPAYQQRDYLKEFGALNPEMSYD